jgi:hypothetical protein
MLLIRKSILPWKTTLHKDHLRKENTTKEKEQMFHKNEIRNSMALSLIRNALFMVGICGTHCLTIHKVRATSHMEPTAIAPFLEDVGNQAGFPNTGRGNGNSHGTGQYAFQTKTPLTATGTLATAPEQHHFDHIGKDPKWG